MIYIPFIIILALVAYIYFVSKDNYNDYLESIDKNDYKLKDFLPLGFWVLDKIKCTYKSQYSRRLLVRCTELNESRYAMFFLKVHFAGKIVISMFLLLFSGFILGAYGEFDLATMIFGLFISVLGFFAPDRELIKKVQNRRLFLRLDFPIFLNKLALLINAGMPISSAWERIAKENKEDTYLYNEVRLTAMKIKGGIAEIVAFEEFARHCKIPEISKFVSLVSQNIRRGGMELSKALKFQSSEAWELRKHAAIRLGEEASTKMLLPMTLMFIAVIIIVAAPAILLLQG